MREETARKEEIAITGEAEGIAVKKETEKTKESVVKEKRVYI